MNISLPSDLGARLRQLAAASGTAPQALIEEAVERLLDDVADRVRQLEDCLPACTVRLFDRPTL